MPLTTAAQQPPPSPPPPPIIVKLIEPENNDPIGLANVVIGALGLSGALALGAILLGVLLAGVLFYVRSRQPLR
ncbi:MAG: hypothetical protein ABI868_13720 [Acidobacteriota bacterium]